ncbi:MAG: hypothetical protein KatS3mg013_1594 [Actinomycetota bacterium]|jgi:hypothetical protein|nr:MAG: hypothetical protein KatS3mg013_1594 [Actinomycetota bacterium]
MGPRMGIRGAARAFGPPILAATLLASALPHALAQSPPPVSLTLLDQTPWVTPERPRLSIQVLVRNDGAARLDDLRVHLVVGPAVGSRFEYEASLVEGPPAAVFIQSTRVDGVVAAGATRALGVRLDTAEVPAIATDESAVYPLEIQLRSRGRVVARLATPLVSIVRAPERPLLFSWWAEFDGSLPMGPDGRVRDPGVEAAIGPGGGLRALTRAVAALAERGTPIDLVVHPALLQQLAAMADGYERTTGVAVAAGTGPAGDAAVLLEVLAAAAATPQVQVSAYPFGGPSIPAMLADGLQHHLAHQRRQAAAWVRATLGVDPAVTVARPPEGLLSPEALAWFAGVGVEAVLADPDAVERPEQPNLFAVPPTATVSTARGTISLVLPDPGAQALLSRPELLADPVRAAQAIVGELAVIWREQPVPPDQPDGTPTRRGIALRLPADLPPTVWEPLAARLARAPFLEPVHAQTFVERVSPAGPEGSLLEPSGTRFDAAYLERLREQRRRVQAFSSMLVDGKGLADRLDRALAIATAAAHLPPNQAAGETWIEEVERVVDATFERVTPTVQAFTLTARDGDIPLLMGDPGPVPLRVLVELQSSRFGFPEGRTREVVLDRPGRIVTFHVVSTTAGRHPIRVLVRSPSGRVISDQTVFVRSTALNRVALLITAVAGALLAVLWLRRRGASR